MQNLVIFKTPEEFSETLGNFIPDSYKNKKDLIQRGVKTFETLDALCVYMVPQDKDINLITQRGSVGKFLKKNFDKVEEKHSSELMEQISALLNKLSADDDLSDIMNLDKIEMMGLMQKKMNGDVKTFVAFLERLFVQADKKEKNVKQALGELDDLAKKYYNEAGALKFIDETSKKLETFLHSLVGFKTKKSELVKDLRLYEAELLKFYSTQKRGA